MNPRPCFYSLLATVMVLGTLTMGCGGAAGLPAVPGGGPAGPESASPLTIVASDFVTVEVGTVPVVISSPHGGTLAIPGVPIRTQGTTTEDYNMQLFARQVQDKFFALTGQKVHLVIAQASRKYVDFNRDALEAYQTASVAPVYAYYQTAIQNGVAAAKALDGEAALLVDLHGQSTKVGVTYRGTQGGLTADLAELYSATGFMTRLNLQGFAINPGTRSARENPNFNGGYLVGTYGRNASTGINAVQLEFGYNFRGTATALEASTTKFAATLRDYLRGKGLLAGLAEDPAEAARIAAEETESLEGESSEGVQ